MSKYSKRPSHFAGNTFTKAKKFFKKKDLRRVERKQHGTLSYEERQALPDQDFAIQKNRRYPIHNEEHARNALARVTQYGTVSEQRAVREAVAERYPSIEQPGDVRERRTHRDVQGKAYTEIYHEQTRKERRN